MSNSTTSNGVEPINAPYGRLESTQFGVYDIWQEKTVVGRKTNHRDVDVDVGTTTLVSRIHFELFLITGTDFQLKCLGKNGIFVNNNYLKMLSTTVLPKQCTLRFPSTDICITFSSLINRTPTENLTRHISTDSVQTRHSSSSIPIENSIPPALVVQSTGNVVNQTTLPVTAQQQQQVILVTVNQQPINHQIQESTSSISPICTNISNLTVPRPISTVKTTFDINLNVNHQHQINSNLLTGSTSPKLLNPDSNENPAIVSSPIVQRLIATGIDGNGTENEQNNSKNGTKPPFSYAQLIVQAISSAGDKQMTLSQIYNYITAQYPYYEANNRGWQNSIRHNLSLNRYFIRVARKDNESGKGSFWRLDQTCEEKLLDHAYRHRKQRTHLSLNNNTNAEMKSDDIHSPTGTFQNEPSDFLLADLHTSNPSTPLSPMTSPLVGPIIEPISPIRSTEDQKRKFQQEKNDDAQIEDLLTELTTNVDQQIKRQKTVE